MRVVQRVGHLGRDPHRLLDPQLLLAVQLVAQRLALDVGHDVVEEAIGLARIEQREDVGVLQVGGGLDLLHEPVGAQHRGELGAKDLDGDLAVVLHVVGQVHRGHAAGPEFPLQGVAAGQRLPKALRDFSHGFQVRATTG